LGIRYVPLLDVAVGVKYGKNDHGYSEGINYDIFLRSSDTGRRYILFAHTL
jgi:alpha-glucosidase/lysosomal alpha-glucosidase